MSINKIYFKYVNGNNYVYMITRKQKYNYKTVFDHEIIKK